MCSKCKFSTYRQMNLTRSIRRLLKAACRFCTLKATFTGVVCPPRRRRLWQEGGDWAVSGRKAGPEPGVGESRATRRRQPPRVCISRCGSRLQRVAGMNDVRPSTARRASAPRSTRALPHAADDRRELGVAGAAAQRSAEIEAAGRVQAGEELPVGGQPGTVAIGAERIGRRRDDADRLSAGQRVARRRRRVAAADRRRSRPNARVDAGEDLRRAARPARSTSASRRRRPCIR